MEEIFGGLFFVVLNFMGASLRWIYGTTWRSLTNRPKFTFTEYLNGPSKKKSTFDSTRDQTIGNIIIGALFFGIVISLLISYF